MRDDRHSDSMYTDSTMYQPIPIKATLLEPENLQRVQQIITERDSATRWAISREVCEQFDFLDAKGQVRGHSCLAALTQLDRQGRIALPPPLEPVAKQINPVNEPVAPALGVPARVDAIEQLEVVPVRTDLERRQWRSLMTLEHPLGSARGAGWQIRYLIRSEHGVLGGFLIASATLVQQTREQYIGWSEAERSANLQRIVGMARFLIRPPIRCANLASRSLGLLSRRVVSDYHLKYGIRPVLIETYVSPEYSGISYQACGWENIGETFGRDRSGRPVPKKAIYVKPLGPAWRAELGISKVKPLHVWEGIDSRNWAEQEFAGARLGDARRVKRLIQIVAVMTGLPSNTFFTAARGDSAMISGYYRLIEHPDEEAINARTILAGHRERTRQRMQAQSVALIVQDGSDLNFASHRGCEGLGLIGRNRHGEGTLGLHLHSTYVVSGEGLPLGVAALQIDRGHQQEQPKTLRWIEGLKDSAELARDLEQVTLIATLDREGDDIKVFDEHRKLQDDLDLLVRARHDRRIVGGSLFARMRAQPVRHRLQIWVPKLSARRAAGTRKAVLGREARDADCELRWMEVTIPIPEKRKQELGDQPVVLNAVHVRESEEPAGDAERLEWLLYTSLPVSNAQQALDVIQYYQLRWRIEDWHRILKSGCDVELLAHRTAERLKRAIALRAVVAWRLATLTLLGRETPGLDPSVLFSEVELAVIRDFARFRNQKLPENLGQAINILAMMGGYLNRPHDASAGSQIMWEGYSYLYGNAQVIERAKALGIGSEVSRMITE